MESTGIYCRSSRSYIHHYDFFCDRHPQGRSPSGLLLCWSRRLDGEVIYFTFILGMLG